MWWNPGLWSGGGVRVGVFGDLMEHKAQCSLWHSKASSVSPPFKPLGMTHLLRCYITHHALRAPAALPMKDSSFMVNFTISVTTEAHQWSTQSFQSPFSVMAQLMASLRRRVYLVSGQRHGFPVHKEDVSICCTVTTDNLLLRSLLYGAPVMLVRAWASQGLQRADALEWNRRDATHTTLHTIWRW